MEAMRIAKKEARRVLDASPEKSRADQILAANPILREGFEHCRSLDRRTFRTLIAGPGRNVTIRRLAGLWMETIFSRLGNIVYGDGLIEGLEARNERLRDETSKENLRNAYRMLDRLTKLRAMEPSFALTPCAKDFIEASGVARIADPTRPGTWQRCSDAIDEIARLVGVRSTTATIASLAEAMERERLSRPLPRRDGRTRNKAARAEEEEVGGGRKRSTLTGTAPIPAENVTCSILVGRLVEKFSVAREVMEYARKLIREHGVDASRHIGWMIAVRISTLRGGYVLTVGSHRGGTVRLGGELEVSLPGGPWTDGFLDTHRDPLLAKIVTKGASEALEAMARLRMPATSNEVESTLNAVAMPPGRLDRPAIETSPTLRYLTVTQAARHLGAKRSSFVRWLSEKGYIDDHGEPTARGRKVSRRSYYVHHWSADFVASLKGRVKRIEGAPDPARKTNLRTKPTSGLRKSPPASPRARQRGRPGGRRKISRA
jgi:hypothetical protein